MQDSKNIIVQAADGYATALSDELDISLARLYEILGKDNPYPKMWRILRPLGRLNPDRLRLVQSDFNARCEAILRPRTTTTTAKLHKELNDVVQAELDGDPLAKRRRELVEAITEAQIRLMEIDRLEEGHNK